MVTRYVAGINGEVIAISDVGTRILSKMKCYEELVKLGIWKEVKSWLEANDLWDGFILAQDIREDNEMFKSGLATFKEKFGVTDEKLEEMLSRCVIGEE